MKILVIGATGTIGKPLYHHLINIGHQVYGAYRTSAEYPVDISDSNSIETLLNTLPKLDAIINVAGTAAWKSLSKLTEEDFYTGIKSKLMGQVNLVLHAQNYLNPKGSILLTTGILADHYEPNTSALALVNGAIHSFVRSAALELPKGIRLNVISPGAILGDFPENKTFANHYPISIDQAIDLYSKALEEQKNGTIYKKY